MMTFHSPDLFKLMMTLAHYDAPELGVQIEPELLALMHGGHKCKLTCPILTAHNVAL